MDSRLYKSLEEIVSTPRLQRYRESATSEFEAVELYCWNIALAESFIPAIALFEVALRNSVHRLLTEREGTEWWFPRVLHPRSFAIIQKISRDLERRNGAAPPVGKVIAEINFGFWPKLFAKRYHQYWWQVPNPPLGLLLRNHPKIARDTRSQFETRLEYFAALRNRVMHQEAIYDGIRAVNRPRIELEVLHGQLVETLEWLHEDARVFASCLDRYPEVAGQPGRKMIAERLLES